MKWRKLGLLCLMPTMRSQADQHGQEEGEARLRALLSQQRYAGPDAVLAEYTAGYLEGYHWLMGAYREAKAEEGLTLDWFKPPGDEQLAQDAERRLGELRRRGWAGDGGIFRFAGGVGDGGGDGGAGGGADGGG